MRKVLFAWDMAFLIGGIICLFTHHIIEGLIMIASVKVTASIQEMMK